MASLTTILNSVVSALTAELFAANTCFISFDPMASLNYPPAQVFAVIQSNNGRVDDRAWDGQDANAYIWRVYFTVWLFVRLSTDEAHRDTEYLLNQSNGALITTDAIIDTLQDYVVTSNAETFGFQLEDFQWQNQDRDSHGWGFVKLSYKTDYNSRSQGQSDK